MTIASRSQRGSRPVEQRSLSNRHPTARVPTCVVTCTRPTLVLYNTDAKMRRNRHPAQRPRTGGGTGTGFSRPFGGPYSTVGRRKWVGAVMMCAPADRDDGIPNADVFAVTPQPQPPSRTKLTLQQNLPPRRRSRPRKVKRRLHRIHIGEYMTMKLDHRSGSPTVVRLFVTFSIVLVMSSSVDGHVIRVKRQLPPIEIGNQVVDDIFQVKYMK